jgi:hypothetical protein
MARRLSKRRYLVEFMRARAFQASTKGPGPEMDDSRFMFKLLSPLGALIRMETTVDAKDEPLFGRSPEYLNDSSAPLHTNTTSNQHSTYTRLLSRTSYFERPGLG